MQRSILKLGKLSSLLAAGLLASHAAIAGSDTANGARTSPQWLRDGVLYEIFPRDFSPDGNLKGVTAHLDQISNLGVNILWIMPIHPIGEKFRKGDFGSPYSISDYYAVDPHYGTLDDFKQLVSEAHMRGLKVIMDLVANHTAWDSVMMTNKDFYKQDAKGNVVPPVPEWTDVAGLNYANPQLREYMINMMKYWVQTCDIDGFRCDVAFNVPTDFWVQARAELEKVKPDIMMLAEGSKPELLKQAFDIDYDWPMLGALNKVIVESAPATEIRHSWETSRMEFPKGSLHMRISDDHDETRAVARFGIHGAVAASALMFTLDGVPVLYNGMEVGDATESGDPALFDKLTIGWHPHGSERPPTRKIYQALINLRKQYPCLETDNVDWLHNSDENDVVTYIRSDANDELLVLINFSNRPVSGKVQMKDGRSFERVPIPGMDGPADGLPSFHLNGFDWQIYHRTAQK